jgi:hypothetical protein
MGKKRESKALLTKVLIISTVLCCVCGVIILRSPLGVCFDLVSGHAPSGAIERFINLLISAALEQNYTWIALYSSEDALNQMKYLRERTIILSEDYIIEHSDDLAGLYEYNVTFERRTIHLGIEAIWPTCPDFDVTEEEILENIRLLGVKSPMIPRVLPPDGE